MTELEALDRIEQRIGDAARHLNPLLADAGSTAGDVARRVHDALNALAAAQLRIGLLQQQLEGSTGT